MWCVCVVVVAVVVVVVVVCVCVCACAKPQPSPTLFICPMRSCSFACSELLPFTSACGLPYSFFLIWDLCASVCDVWWITIITVTIIVICSDERGTRMDELLRTCLQFRPHLGHDSVCLRPRL